MNVYIPIFSSAIAGRTFAIRRGNPGIGGTQFTTIQLAYFLGERHPDWHICLINDADFLLEQYPENVRVISGESLDGIGNWLDRQPEGVVIWIAQCIPRIGLERLRQLAGRHIVWSRHPFDHVVREIASKRLPMDIVCVGEYQWHSNYFRQCNVHFIQEIFYAHEDKKVAQVAALSEMEFFAKFDVRIAYVGALVPAKGFLEIAKAWPKLRKLFPQLTLEVIGGGDLYGTSVNGRLIPAERSFEQRILAHIPEDDIRTGRVIFHGVLGEEKWAVLKRCHLAIQNPTGNSEAFPASPLEAMSAGLPVIGSDDYGMADCMRYFPELVVNRRHSIVSRVAWLLADPDRYVEMQRRAIACADKFRDRRSEILSAWDSLLEPAATAPGGSALRPKNKLHGSGIKLRYRRDWLPRLRSIKQRVSSFLRRWRT